MLIKQIKYKTSTGIWYNSYFQNIDKILPIHVLLTTLKYRNINKNQRTFHPQVSYIGIVSDRKLNEATSNILLKLYISHDLILDNIMHELISQNQSDKICTFQT